MAMEFKSGLMVLVMKETGLRIKPVVKANSGTLMATCLKGNGSMIKPKVMEFTHTLMDLIMKVTGKQIYNMEKAKSSGLINPTMKESTAWVRNMVMGIISGLMAAAIMDLGLKTVLKVMELTVG